MRFFPGRGGRPSGACAPVEPADADGIVSWAGYLDPRHIAQHEAQSDDALGEVPEGNRRDSEFAEGGDTRDLRRRILDLEREVMQALALPMPPLIR